MTIEGNSSGRQAEWVAGRNKESRHPAWNAASDAIQEETSVMSFDSTHEPGTLAFIVATEDSGRSTGEKGLFGSRGEEPRVVSVRVDHLKKSLRETLDGLREAFDTLDAVRSDLQLKEVQLSFEVTATGKIAILGTGAEVAGKGAITVSFGK